MSGVDLAVEAAQNHRSLRGLGIAICKTIDLAIGTFCIREGRSLLRKDRDFVPMAELSGLKLFCRPRPLPPSRPAAIRPSMSIARAHRENALRPSLAGETLRAFSSTLLLLGLIGDRRAR